MIKISADFTGLSLDQKMTAASQLAYTLQSGQAVPVVVSFVHRYVDGTPVNWSAGYDKEYWAKPEGKPRYKKINGGWGRVVNMEEEN